MQKNKYINTPEAVKLTGLSTKEIYDLIHEGVLPAHKSRKGNWRISPQDLADLGLIKEEPKSTTEVSPKKPSVTKPSPIKLSPEEPPSARDQWCFIADDDHFDVVFKHMTEVKSSLKIATGDLKNFNVHVAGKNEPIRLCHFFLSLVKRGVEVKIVCMKPFGFYLYAKENCPQLLTNPLFELRLNENNHMKMFVFDDSAVYFGSANITSAAIGKRSSGNRNHEAGMLVWGPNIIKEPLKQFDTVWNDEKRMFKSTWKRFEAKVKEFEKLRG